MHNYHTLLYPLLVLMLLAACGKVPKEKSEVPPPKTKQEDENDQNAAAEAAQLNIDLMEAVVFQNATSLTKILQQHLEKIEEKTLKKACITAIEKVNADNNAVAIVEIIFNLGKEKISENTLKEARTRAEGLGDPKAKEKILKLLRGES